MLSTTIPPEPSEPDDGQLVLVDVGDGVATVTLNRPQRLNAMSVPLMDELVSKLSSLASDTAVRCVALHGAGRAFCAGGDTADIAARRAAAAAAPSLGTLMEQQARMMVRHTESVRLLHTMPKPTVAVVQGHAVGGGLSLALACDIRIVAETAQLRVGFGPRSLSGDFGISYLLTHVVGGARARQLMLLDPVIDGREAVQIGMAMSAYPDSELAAAGLECARTLGAGPTIALGRMKDNLLASETQRLDEVLALEALNQRISANTADAAEAGRAAAERRAPRFTGT